ncbi:MAG: acetate--CoA ligase family protein, partial [Chloroflexota bacterium]
GVAEGAPPGADPLAALRALIAPRSVALVGASGNPEATAGRPLRYLLEHGYQGVVYPVNPRYPTLGGLRCYPSVEALPQAPDVGLVLLGPDRAAIAVQQLAERGTLAAIVLAGGYAEVGPEGEARQRELLRAAGPMRLLGPNSMGVVNAAVGAALSPSGALEARPLPRGGVGVVSQSGGILGSLLSRGGARGIGFSTLVATGNEADLEVADFLELLLEDVDTRVIALYLEGLRNPARFARLARRARAMGKPVVVYKVGRSEAGARSAASHTGAMAGSNRAYDAYFRQLGVVRVEAFGELLDVSSALAAGRPMRGNRLGVLTSTGGAGVLLADAAGAHGIEAPPLDAALTRDMRALLTDEGAVAGRNPVDITLAGLKPEVFASATASLLGSPSYDAVVVVVGASGLANPDLAAKPLIEAGRTASKPLLGYVSPHAPDILARLNRGNIPTFDSPEGCAAALAALCQVAGWASAEAGDGTIQRGPDFTGAAEPNQNGVARFGQAPASAPAPLAIGALPSGMLNEVQAAAVFSAFGIPSARSVSVADAAQVTPAAVSLGSEVVLKVLSRQIAHKSDVGGVLVGLAAERAG